MRTITITTGKGGKTVVETSGFVGQSCEEVLRNIRLGVIEEKTYKQDYHMVELVQQDTQA